MTSDRSTQIKFCILANMKEKKKKHIAEIIAFLFRGHSSKGKEKNMMGLIVVLVYFLRISLIQGLVLCHLISSIRCRSSSRFGVASWWGHFSGDYWLHILALAGDLAIGSLVFEINVSHLQSFTSMDSTANKIHS